MNSTDAFRQDAAPTAPDHGADQLELIKQHLPTWLTQAPANLRTQFRNILPTAQASRQQVSAILHQLQAPQTFCRPLLAEALTREYYGALDINKATLVREWKKHYLLGAVRLTLGTSEQSLLEAAMQNFEQAEHYGNFEEGSALYSEGRRQLKISPIAPQYFAGTCRRLDLGRRYQAHISSVVDAAHGTGTARQSTAQLISNNERNVFELGAHTALMKRQITSEQHHLLMDVSHQRYSEQLSAQTPRYSHLTINNVVLPGILIIGLKPENELTDACLIYTPDDPAHPFKRYASFDEYTDELASRLLDADFGEFFNRFIPIRHQPALFTVNAAQTVPATYDGPELTLLPHIEEPVTRTVAILDPFVEIGSRYIAKIKSDARALVVPSADADARTRIEEQRKHEERGRNVLFFALSFVPVVGEVMLTLTALSLIEDLYHGFDAWSRAEKGEALAHFMDAVDTVALFGATAGAVKGTRFLSQLVPIQLANRKPRLWNPDLAPYRHTLKLPASLRPNQRGIYALENKNYVLLDDHAYEVTAGQGKDQWHITHRHDPLYRPPLRHNKLGAWRQTQERVHEWTDLQLLRRLGFHSNGLTAEEVPAVLMISDVDLPTLRRVHIDSQRPPPLLLDTLTRFRLFREVQTFTYERARGTEVTPASPFIQMHLLSQQANWPANTLLQMIDDAGMTVTAVGQRATTESVQKTTILITQAQLRSGQLLDLLVAGMSAEDMHQWHPFSRRLPKDRHAHFIAVQLQASAQNHPGSTFKALYKSSGNFLNAEETQLHHDLPLLPSPQLRALTATLTTREVRHILNQRRILPRMRDEGYAMLNDVGTARAFEGLHLDHGLDPNTDRLVFGLLETLPGWSHETRLVLHEGSRQGPVLTSTENHSQIKFRTHLIKQDTLYQTANDPSPRDLFNTVQQALPLNVRQAMGIDGSGQPSALKTLIINAAHRLRQEMKNWRRRLAPSGPDYRIDGYPLNVNFARTENLQGLRLRQDGAYKGIYEQHGTLPLSQYYILDRNRYYQVEYAAPGWQLVDARSPYRAYRPYVRAKNQGGWELDVSMGLQGGSPGAHGSKLQSSSSSGEYMSTVSRSSTYVSSTEFVAPEPFSAEERKQMRALKSFQDGRNLRATYDRANNGRYPLRDLQGKTLRIKKIESMGTSSSSGSIFSHQLLLPYLQWKGYEKVANLYEEKLHVRTFAARDQRSPEEASLIGQSMVVARRALKKGEALGVYGGGLIPTFIASARKDPFVLDVLSPTQPGSVTRQKSLASALRPHVVLSGDNILSRLNTIFEYRAGQPVRQASSGYNIEVAFFNVDTVSTAGEKEQFKLLGMFASEDIPADHELRWNYGYDENAIRLLFTDG